MFSKVDGRYVVHASAADEIHAILQENNAKGDVGEVYCKDLNIVICIGDLRKEEAVRRANIKKAMKNLYNTLKRFDKSEIVFEENEDVEDDVVDIVKLQLRFS